jgi:hypothetical protein
VFTARYVLHSTFCPRSVFMCFEWISEQTQCLYSTVQTEYLNTIEAKLSVYSMKRPVFDPRPVRVRFVVYKMSLGQISSPSTSVLPCRYHSANSPRWSLSKCCSNQKDKRAKPGDLQESKAALQIAKNWVQNYFHWTSMVKETAQRSPAAVANSHARDFNAGYAQMPACSSEC